jgi:CTP synthase
MPESAQEKISMFSHVAKEQVICLPDVNTIYKVPVILYKHKLAEWFSERLSLDQVKQKLQSLESKSSDLSSHKNSNCIVKEWALLADRWESMTKTIEIALVGKYTTQSDTYTSILKSLEHAGLQCNRKVKIKYIDSSDLENDSQKQDPVKYHEAWQGLCKADGILVPGGFGIRGTEGMICAAKWARVNQKPFLGICLGFQCAVIDYCRNVLNIKDATSAEFDKIGSENLVIIEMPEHNTGQMGGTMRLGKRKTLFTKDCVLRKLYGDVDSVDERHRHRYEVNPLYVKDLESNGMEFVGRSEDGNRMEIMELKNHPYFVGVQYHPEYLSRPSNSSAPFHGLILATCSKLKSHLNKLANNLISKRSSLDQLNDSL